MTFKVLLHDSTISWEILENAFSNRMKFNSSILNK